MMKKTYVLPQFELAEFAAADMVAAISVLDPTDPGFGGDDTLD